jgi:hypothetical protein
MRWGGLHVVGGVGGDGLSVGFPRMQVYVCETLAREFRSTRKMVSQFLLDQRSVIRDTGTGSRIALTYIPT